MRWSLFQTLIFPWFLAFAMLEVPLCSAQSAAEVGLLPPKPRVPVPERALPVPGPELPSAPKPGLPAVEIKPKPLLARCVGGAVTRFPGLYWAYDLVKNGDSDFKEGLHAIKTPTAQSRFIGAAQLAQGGVYAVDAAAGGIVIVAEGAALLGVTTGALAGMGTSASAVLAVTGPAALAGVGVGLPAVLLIDYISENNAAVALSSMEREESNLQEVGFLCDRTEADLLRQECEYYNPKNPRSTPYPGPTFSPSEFAEMRKRILEEEIPKCKETMRDALQRGDCSMESGGSEWQSMRCRSIRNVMCNVRPESALRRARLKKKLEALGLGDVNCGVPTYAPVTPSPVWNLPPL